MALTFPSCLAMIPVMEHLFEQFSWPWPTCIRCGVIKGSGADDGKCRVSVLDAEHESLSILRLDDGLIFQVDRGQFE